MTIRKLFYRRTQLHTARAPNTSTVNIESSSVFGVDVSSTSDDEFFINHTI